MDGLKDLVRRVAKKDIEKWKEEWSAIPDSRETQRTFTRKDGESVDVIFISNKLGVRAKVNGQEMGRGRIIYSQGDTKAVIEDGFVEEAYRRMGIGSSMLELAKEEAQKNGAQEIVVEANKNSIGIATKLGGMTVERF